MKIKTLSTTEARARLGDIVSEVYTSGIGVVIGRRNDPLAVLVSFPKAYNPNISEITNINAYSRSFDFLINEPDLYSKSDLKKDMYKPGKIVLIPFPFTDLSGEKIRPALILASKSTHVDITVCFITSVIKKEDYYTIIILEKDLFFKKTGLKFMSSVNVSKIATLDKKVILGEIGELDPKIFAQVKTKLKKYLQI